MECEVCFIEWNVMHVCVKLHFSVRYGHASDDGMPRISLVVWLLLPGRAVVKIVLILFSSLDHPTQSDMTRHSVTNP